MATPDLSILVLLLFICCFLFYSQFNKGEFSKKNYYEQYSSTIVIIILPFAIIFLLAAIFNKLLTNS